LAALVVAGFLLFAYNDGPPSLEPGEARPEAVAAKAIDRFEAKFSGQVADVETVVVPASLDLTKVSTALTSERQLVDERLDDEPHWRVVSVNEISNYWVVEMHSDADSFFGGEIFFPVDVEGEIYRISPADVGVTPTTSVS
jgi:hypothetical protein